jgi:two-component system chemotaxis response regulator CheB
MKPRLVVAGAPSRGLYAQEEVLGVLPSDFALPILVAQHLPADDGGNFASSLSAVVRLRVATPVDKQPIQPGWVFVAPAGYHRLVEREGYVALSVDETVCRSLPSVDVLFESAAFSLGAAVETHSLSGIAALLCMIGESHA